MVYFKVLDNTSIEIIYKTFLQAFCDYQVEIELPFWKFQQMIKRRGFEAQISIGAFENERLVGFVLNGLREWKGKSTAYDLGTGVIPEYRRQGLTTDIIQNIKKLFKEKQVEQYLLEVLKPNESAIQLYKKEGFKIERELSCFEMNKDDFISKTTCVVEKVEKIDLEQLKSFWDFKPSWQNSIDSIYAIPEEFIYSVVYVNNIIVGYGIIEKRTGDIPQFAVKKEYRGQGIASSIITELIKNTESSNINVVNTVAQYKGIEKFLVKLGFKYEVGQYEMLLNL